MLVSYSDTLYGHLLIVYSSGGLVNNLPGIAKTQTDPHGTLWIIVKASIDDWIATLKKMSSMLDDAQKADTYGRGFVRWPTKQMKFSSKAKDISVYKQRVQSHNSAVQSALRMMNLCVLRPAFTHDRLRPS